MALLPRFPLDTLDKLVVCADWVHEDRCMWMGHDSPRPCTCRIPELIRALAAERALPGGQAAAVDGRG